MRLVDVLAWFGRFLFLALLARGAWQALAAAWSAYQRAGADRERVDVSS